MGCVYALSPSLLNLPLQEGRADTDWEVKEPLNFYFFCNKCGVSGRLLQRSFFFSPLPLIVVPFISNGLCGT